MFLQKITTGVANFGGVLASGVVIGWAARSAIQPVSTRGQTVSLDNSAMLKQEVDGLRNRILVVEERQRQEASQRLQERAITAVEDDYIRRVYPG